MAYSAYGRKRKRRKAEDDHQTAFTPRPNPNTWQTKKHGKMHGTVPFGRGAKNPTEDSGFFLPSLHGNKKGTQRPIPKLEKLGKVRKRRRYQAW